MGRRRSLERLLVDDALALELEAEADMEAIGTVRVVDMHAQRSLGHSPSAEFLEALADECRRNTSAFALTSRRDEFAPTAAVFVAVCVDDRDPSPTVMGTLNGVPVDDGQEVLFVQSARSKWELRDGTLWIWGPMLRLVVEREDEAGNTDVDVATVRLRRGPRIN